MSNQCRPDTAPAMPRRDRILRAARTVPSLSVNQLAACVDCKPDEVHRCLGGAGFATQMAARQALLLAEDPRCTPQQLEQLSMSLGPSTREKTARHPNCSPRTLVRLANDSIHKVRKNVAYNSACPTPVLGRLANDKNRWVREAAARSQRCPPHVLDRLANEQDAQVRRAVAESSR